MEDYKVILVLTMSMPEALKEPQTRKITLETRSGYSHGICTAMDGRTGSVSPEKELTLLN